MASNLARTSSALSYAELRDAGDGYVFGFQLNSWPGNTIGTITPEEAQRRAAANLEQLRAQLPPGVITSAHASVLPMTETNYFGVQVDIEVSSAEQMQGHLDELTSVGHDIVDNVEGYEQEVHDPAGRRYGGWSLRRFGMGAGDHDPAYFALVTEKRAWRRPADAPARPKRAARTVRIQVDSVYCDRSKRLIVRRHRHDVTITAIVTRLADTTGTRCATPFSPPERVDLKGRLGDRVILDGGVQPPAVRYRFPR